MKQNRKSRNEPTHMWPVCFWGKCKGNSIGWKNFFPTNGIKTGVYPYGRINVFLS